MQLLYLIGNGFDINLKMKTRYTEFLEFYQAIDTESAVLKELKDNIKQDVYTWSDLEYRLGQYMNGLKKYEEFEEIYDDLLEKFGDYLQDIEENFDWKSVNIEKFKMDLCNPEMSLMQKEINALTEFKNKFAKNAWRIDIVTFNYTRSIERLLNENFTNLALGTHHVGENISLRKVWHIHGDLNNMVLGVNDISQLNNENFHKNKKILNAFIKEYNNRRQGHTIDEILEKKISSANLICIFGSSLGETDKLWWEKIGIQLLKSEHCKLIIFTNTNIQPKRAIHKKGDFEDDVRETFLKRTNLSESDTEIINDQIYVRANTNMFSELLK
jgi:hypothetical protein